MNKKYEVAVNLQQDFTASEQTQGRNNIGAASASDVTALQSQVSSLSDVSAYSVKGEATVAQLNAGPSGIQAGWAYQLTDSGTLTEGTLAVVAGDTVAWDGTKWFPLVKSDYYATKTYAQNVAHSIAPEFDPTRDYVIGDDCTYEGKAYIFTSNHPAGAWNPSHATISGQNALLRLTEQNTLAGDDNPTDLSSLRIFGKDKHSGDKIWLDGGYVAPANDFYNLENDSRGVPYVIDRGSSKVGQIVGDHWYYLDTPANLHFVIEVSRLRGKHITDTSGETHEYTFLSDYVTPVTDEKVIFCHGETLHSGVITSVLVPDDAKYLYVNYFSGYVAPQIRCDDTKFGKFDELANLNNSVYGKTISDVQYSQMTNQRIANAVVGTAITFNSSSYRHVGQVILPTDMGLLCVDKVLHNASSTYDVVVCDQNDIVIGGKTYTEDNNYPFPVYLNLADYPNAKKLYFNYSITTAEAPSVSIDFKSIERETFSKKGVILLHFDGSEYSYNGSIVSSRKALLEEYGIKKASACLLPQLFGDITDSTFSSWRNQDLEAEYWACVKDGWDFALYPAMYASEKDESEWNNFMDVAFGNLANLNIHNITTWACSRLDVTHDLLNACIKHNIKVVRGGSAGDSISQGDYDYTDSNIYMPTSETYETTLVNKTFFYGANTSLEVLKASIRRAADTKTAISIFTHQVLDTVSDPTVNCTTAHFRELLQFIKSMVDAGEIEVMSWREYYASASARDGYENDYNRLLKMSL